MKLLAAAATIITASAIAAEDSATQQELASVKTSNQVMSAVWKRQPDSYTLQIVLDRTRYAARSGMPAAQQQATVNVSDALLELMPQRSGSYQPFAVSSTAQQPTVVPAGPPDRSSYFIGDAVANLRGIDPWIACGRTLTLVDGRRVVQGRSTPAPAVAPAPAPVKPPAPGSLLGKERRVEVWLLRGDGTFIQPSNYSCEDPAKTSPGRPDVSISYGYSIADSAQAVAAAIRIDNEYFIEKLQPLLQAPAAQ